LATGLAMGSGVSAAGSTAGGLAARRSWALCISTFAVASVVASPTTIQVTAHAICRIIFAPGLQTLADRYLPEQLCTYNANCRQSPAGRQPLSQSCAVTAIADGVN
jgi:hypothetical protein